MSRPAWHTPPDAEVSAWVAAAAGPGWRVTRMTRMRGGMATAADAADLVRADGARLRLVLRRWLRPDLEADPEVTPAREAAVLARIGASDLPVPRVVAVDPDGRETGAPAILVTHLEGRRSSPATERRPAVIAGMADALVRIHALDLGLRHVVSPFEPYLDLARTRPPAGSSRPALWERAIQAGAEGPPAGREAFIHRDYHPGNTLWAGRRLTGIVDWAGASWGPPSTDLAHWRANLGTRHGVEVADEAATAYAAAGGDAPGLPWWDVRMLLDYVVDQDLDPPGTLDRTEAYLEALLDRL